MLRVFLYILGTLSSLFFVVIMLIRFQPYNENSIFSLLTPLTDCAAPCFVGIYPGTTTPQEALTILDQHPWVEETILVENALGDGDIWWRWNTLVPSAFHVDDERYNGGIVRFSSGIVRSINLSTPVPLGVFWIKWGEPDFYSFPEPLNAVGLSVRRDYLLDYSNPQVFLTATVFCPFSTELWDSRVWLEWNEPAHDSLSLLDIQRDTGFLKHFIAEEQLVCGR